MLFSIKRTLSLKHNSLTMPTGQREACIYYNQTIKQQMMWAWSKSVTRRDVFSNSKDALET